MRTKRTEKRGKLSHEVLRLFFICVAITLAVYFFLAVSCTALVESYCWRNDILLTEDRIFHLDAVVFSVSLAVSVLFFVVLFLTLFGERLSYIGTIIRGVETLRRGEFGSCVPIEGNNELTALAEAINYLSETERAAKEKERRLYEEREELIRTLSHDIRTPLTSVISYTELFSVKESFTPEELSAYLALVRNKAGQIKELTDILLDGGKRELEFFEDARLLIAQTVGEFEERLEEEYLLSVDLFSCPAFSGNFDVSELRRLFDNLVSNVEKYADPQQTVFLSVRKDEDGLVIRQKNAVRAHTEQKESYRMGLQSIRRIAQNYGGGTDIRRENGMFEITITLSKF
ncbi:MAG: HAMP domain-containing histidine kinase [Clostridia bacterium]|nr:HAMP domain-containing histidine kinase [Clostridia bacterium]